MIMVDGIDGVGKSTQIELLNARLVSDGYKVKTARIPGGTIIGEELRVVMLGDSPRGGLTDLYTAMAINTQLALEAKKWRQDNYIVLVDRSPYSLIAYEAFAEAVDLKLTNKLFESAKELLNPDLVIIYDLETKESLRRDAIKKQKRDYFSKHDIGFFEKARKGFKYAVKHYPENVELLDVSGQSVNQVAELTFAVVSNTLTNSLNK